MEKATGKTPEELLGPDLPRGVEYLWNNFREISSSRTFNQNGPNPISYQDIKAWKELTENPILPWEVSAIKRIDEVYIKVSYDRRSN